MTKLVVIRIRGTVGISRRIADTMKKLRLFKKHNCSVVNDTKEIRGMLTKIKDYCTFGEVDAKTFEELLTKRGRIIGNKPFTEDWLRKYGKLDLKQFVDKFMKGEVALKDVPGLRPYFRLSPPKGGFERAGIKKPFSVGGVLGYRKEKIVELIRRMI